MFLDLCIWLSTQNWKRVARKAAVIYCFMLAGALGTNLINAGRIPSACAFVGYSLLIASYVATGVMWSK